MKSAVLDFNHLWMVLLIFVPVPIIGCALGWSPVVIFVTACLGIVPLAGFMGKATEYLAERIGEGPGALLNASFGNACELIIALAALRAGLIDIVKASITGSIIGNILLVLGASMLAGGVRYETQTFNRVAATTSATLLALAATSLTVPAVFHFSASREARINEQGLGLAIAVVLFITYLMSLWFSLKTHKHLYVREFDTEAEAAIGVFGWGIRKSLTILLGSTVLVAILSEYLVAEVTHCAETLGMSQLFIGLVVIAIIGNAAEHSTAVLMAMKNKMDLAINIALGSGTQIALFVAPVLVFVSFFIGKPMDLAFTPFEVLAVVVSVIILSFVATDGECN
ncbi:MAG: calcium/proton exchanger, partial [Candidatus Melainabacteria bacterium]|nr:calcium/proton exchanger [Candidatus Melainabacteria bacterium]